MINPVDYFYQKAQKVEWGSHTERFISMTPVINSIFLEMKRDAQLKGHLRTPELKNFAETTHYWLWPQIILWAPVIAQLQRYLSIKNHTTLMLSFSLYILAADQRISYIKDLD